MGKDPDLSTPLGKGLAALCLALPDDRVERLLAYVALPARWNAAFQNIIWPILGFIFAPWTTMMYVLICPGGLNGIDWRLFGLGFLDDIV